MMKSFKVVSADVKSDKSSVESFAAGRDATVVVRFDRPLSKLEALRVSKEAAKLVSDDVRVNVSNTKAVIETREFEAVKSFIEAANSYSQEWTEDAGRELERVKAELESVQDGLKSLVRWQKPQQQFL